LIKLRPEKVIQVRSYRRTFACIGWGPKEISTVGRLAYKGVPKGGNQHVGPSEEFSSARVWILALNRCEVIGEVVESM